MNSNECDKCAELTWRWCYKVGESGGRLSPGPPTKTNPCAAVFRLSIIACFRFTCYFAVGPFNLCLNFFIHLNRRVIKAAGSGAEPFSSKLLHHKKKKRVCGFRLVRNKIPF